MKTVNTHHLIKLQQLHEYLVKSEETLGFDPMKISGQRGYKQHVGWEDTNSDKFIHGINNIKHVYRGPMSKHTYEFDTEKDRLRFKDENEVFSTTMASTYGYTIGKLVDRQASGMSSDEATSLNPDNTTVLIIHNKKHEIKSLANLSDDDVVSIIGTISQDGSYEQNPLYSSEIDSDKRPQWLRYTQTVLDFAGFIPVIGDALDIINAAIYFAYGKTIDGILSLIAVIPIIGSAIALPIKGILKAGGKVGKEIKLAFGIGSKTGDFAKGFEVLAEKGLLDPTHIPALEKGLADIVARGKSAAKSGYLPKDLAKIIDDFAVSLEKTSGKIGQIEAKTTFKSVGKALEKSRAATKANFWRRFNPVKMDFIKKYTFFPTKQVERIAENLIKNFRVKMINNPADLTAMIKTSSTGVSTGMVNTIHKLAQSKGKGGIIPTNWNPSKGFAAVEDNLKFLKSKLPAKDYELLADNLIKTGQNGGSVVWNMYKTSHLNNVKAYANMDGWYRNLQLQNAKWFDIVSNELQSMGVDLGVIDESNAEKALFYPIISKLVNEKLPGVADSFRAIRDNELVQGTMAAGKAILGYAGEAAGISDSEKYDFEQSYEDEQ